MESLTVFFIVMENLSASWNTAKKKVGNCPSWTGGVARSAGVVFQEELPGQPPRLRELVMLRTSFYSRSHPSCPGGVICSDQFLHSLGYLNAHRIERLRQNFSDEFHNGQIEHSPLPIGFRKDPVAVIKEVE